MTVKPAFGVVALMSVLALCHSPAVLAQVDWTWGVLEVPPGDPGSWDSGRHQVGDVVFDGSMYHMYLVGGQTLLSWDSPWSVGHWTSNSLDGPWAADLANPVLEPDPGQWDSYTIYSTAVLYDADTSMFRMWYGATSSYQGQVHVGYADSPDGSTWTKYVNNPLTSLEPGIPGAWDDWGNSPNSVLKSGSSYDVWFTAFEHNGGAIDHWRIGHATSTDGLEWAKTPDPVLEGTEPWESTRLYFPEVVRIGDGYGMWYSGLIWSSDLAYIGYAVSPDGIHWGKWSDNPVISPLPTCNAVDSFAAFRLGDTIHGWITNCFDVHHLTSPSEVLLFDGFESEDTTIWGSAVP